jgi:desulfoferrodoxin (superoxide reductase-like protein)
MMATTRREFLQAGMAAGLAAATTLPALKALASCNLHGLWENTIIA